MVRKTRRDKATDIYYKISPLYLAAIVMLNFLLVYLNLVSLENQTRILNDIENNTEIALVNQELGLNVSQHNKEMLERIIHVQQVLNLTLQGLDINLSSSDLS